MFLKLLFFVVLMLLPLLVAQVLNRSDYKARYFWRSYAVLLLVAQGCPYFGYRYGFRYPKTSGDWTEYLWATQLFSEWLWGTHKPSLRWSLDRSGGGSSSPVRWVPFYLFIRHWRFGVQILNWLGRVLNVSKFAHIPQWGECSINYMSAIGG